MANKIILSKIKSEIESRKKEKNKIPSHLGESVSDGAPRDQLLHGLLVSLDTGRETASTRLIKTVDNKVADKNKESRKLSIREDVAPPRQEKPVDMSPERDEQMWRDINAKKDRTLAESIENFSSNEGIKPQQPYVDYAGQKYLTSQPEKRPMTEGYLIEDVQKIVTGYLTENLAPIFEEAIKNTIIEMYATERIKEVLDENKDLIKKMVYEVIREIREKKKPEAQQ